MKLLLLLLLGMGVALAHEPAYVQMSRLGGENITYAYADVLRAIPTYDLVPVAGVHAECDTAPGAATVPGEVVIQPADHVLTLAAASGSLPVCAASTGKHEERRISGYDVEYRYKGESYMSHMGYDPGDKLRIRITVAPVD